jgi:RimK family alpha-L-glutamate ligase
MKISVIAKGETWHTKQLELEAEKRGIDFELVNVPNLTRMRERIESLGEAVIWRSSNLDLRIGRTVFVERLARKRVVINEVIGKSPFVAHKFYQQKLVEPLKTVLSIPTYFFKSRKRFLVALDNEVLKFPLIMKADLGARGEKVFLIRDRKEAEEINVNFRDYVFQNYIKNNGDYRVFVLGGVVLGVVKRMAKEGEFRNNVSQGARAVDARDFPEAEELGDKALTLASLFGLQLCGVDFIQNQETGEFHFLEINTVVQWQGFQGATGVNVAVEIVEYCRMMVERKTRERSELVREYYEHFGKYMSVSEQIHFWTRRFWWTKNDKDKENLLGLEDRYVGKGDEGVRERVANLVKYAEGDLRAMIEKEQTERRKAYAVYPRVMVINYLLFYWFVCRSVYGREVRNLTEEVLGDGEIKDLRERVMNDRENLRGLATGGVNFLYLSSEYLNLTNPKLEWLVEVSGRLASKPTNLEELRPWFYSLTHMIIGESLFYTRKIQEDKRIIEKILQIIEGQIEDHFFGVSLDMKMEFLVCCRLVGYESFLKKMIMNEAEKSLSPNGNYLVDTLNDWKNRHTHKMTQAEHRNVLYLTVLVGGQCFLNFRNLE